MCDIIAAIVVCCNEFYINEVWWFKITTSKEANDIVVFK